MIGIYVLILLIVLVYHGLKWLFNCIATVNDSLTTSQTTSCKRIYYKTQPARNKKRLTPEQVLKAQQDICKARSVIEHYSEQLNFYRQAEADEWNQEKRIRYSERCFKIEQKLESAYFQIERAEKRLATR